MSRIDELKEAYSCLGEAAADLSFAGCDRLSRRAKDLQEEVEEYIEWEGGEE